MSTLSLRLLSMMVALALLGGCAGAMLPAASSPASTTPSIDQPKPPKETLTVSWFNQDTLNPYSCKTLQNYYLAGLLCDPLVALDSRMAPQNRLALEISENQNVYTIVLRPDARFADGSPLTAQDVLYSLGLAQASPRFSAALAGVEAATATENGSVRITLKAPEQLFSNSLVFPILKDGTGEAPVPVGVGRFTYSDGGQKLLRSTTYYSPVKTIREISLLPVASMEAQSFAIMEGRIDLMYSNLQNDLSPGLGMGYRQIPLSNLLYLGVNGASPAGELPVRQALSGLLNREAMVRKIYGGFATATILPVNPVIAATTLSATDTEVNLPQQAAKLEKAGWVLGKDGLRYRTGLPLKLELLVNSEVASRKAIAELITQSCKEAGILVTVVSLPYPAYQERIAKGEYDLYLGEVAIPYNQNLAPLLLPGGALNPAAPNIPALAALYPHVRSGQAEEAALEKLLETSLPILPLLFRRGIICFSRDFSANMVATEQDIFYNIVDW